VCEREIKIDFILKSFNLEKCNKLHPNPKTEEPKLSEFMFPDVKSAVESEFGIKNMIPRVFQHSPDKPSNFSFRIGFHVFSVFRSLFVQRITYHRTIDINIDTREFKIQGTKIRNPRT